MCKTILIFAIFGIQVIKVNPISQKCSTQYEYFKESLAREFEWARKLRDSWGNFPSGTFSGNRFDFGSFDQCLKIHQNVDFADTINGQYCLIFLEVPKKRITEKIFPATRNPETNFGIGFCLPDSCLSNDSQIIAENELKTITNATLAVNYDQTLFCTTSHQPIEWNILQITAMVLFFIILLIISISTAIDVSSRLRKSTKFSILKSFSILSNSEIILSLKHNPSDMKFLHGIRSISIIWIVFCHSYGLLYKSVPAINSFTILDRIKNPLTLFIFSGFLGVDTFFLLSSLLLTLSFFKQLEKTNKINVLQLLVKRYFRLTIPLAAAILLTLTFYIHLGDGPLWKTTTKLATMDYCKKSYWTVLTYIGNYATPGEICFGHSWYLMVDMQLYFFSPLILYLIWKLRKHSKFVISLIFAIASFSIIYVFTYMMVNDLPYRILGEDSRKIEFNSNIYTLAHTRLDTWLMGILGGFLLMKMNGKVVNFSRNTIFLGWFISMMTIFSLIFVQYPFHQENGDDYAVIYSASYEALKRILWSLAILWIIIACQLSHGGIAGRILSSEMWLPISKLSYCLYLMHLPVQLYFASTIRVPQVFSTFGSFHKFFGDLGLSICIAFLWSLLFELPTLNIIAYLTKKNQ